MFKFKKKSHPYQPESPTKDDFFYWLGCIKLFETMKVWPASPRLDPAGLGQLGPGGGGAVEGHDGAPRESGGGVAPAEPFLSVLPEDPWMLTLSCCSSSCTRSLFQAAGRSRARRRGRQSQNRTANSVRRALTALGGSSGVQGPVVKGGRGGLNKVWTTWKCFLTSSEHFLN